MIMVGMIGLVVFQHTSSPRAVTQSAIKRVVAAHIVTDIFLPTFVQTATVLLNATGLELTQLCKSDEHKGHLVQCQENLHGLLVTTL